MDRKARAQLLLILLAVICSGAVAGVIWYRNRPIGLEDQMRRMPTRDTILLYVDFDALRRAGMLQLLATAKASEDVDYKQFVLDTGFDYQQDLESALVAFAPTGNYMLVRGGFDWKKLHNYANAHDGNCYISTCQMPGSKPERRISFLSLQSRLMALAVSPDENAVSSLTGMRPGAAPKVPNAPVWLGMSGSVLKSGQSFPSGTRMFARTMERADYLTIGLVPESGRFAAKLDVRFPSPGDASQIAAELNRITGMLREMIQRENGKANPADLSGVLTSGSFRAEGDRVYGYWPIERAFLENILNGGVS